MENEYERLCILVAGNQIIAAARDLYEMNPEYAEKFISLAAEMLILTKIPKEGTTYDKKCETKESVTTRTVASNTGAKGGGSIPWSLPRLSDSQAT